MIVADPLLLEIDGKELDLLPLKEEEEVASVLP